MARSLLPSIWRRGERSLPNAEYPLFSLHREIDRMFDDVSRRFHLSLFDDFRDMGEFNPSVDVQEDRKGMHIKAELPGVDEKDVEVTVTGNSLRIKGEKKEETEEKGEEGYRLHESRYGSFDRVLTLPECGNSLDGRRKSEAEKQEDRHQSGITNTNPSFQKRISPVRGKSFSF